VLHDNFIRSVGGISNGVLKGEEEELLDGEPSSYVASPMEY